MKKKIIVIVAMLVLAFVVFALANQKMFNLFEKADPKPVSYDNYTLLYVLNDHNQLVGIKVGTNGVIEDEVKHKWNILTYDYQKLPKGYKSPIYVSTSLVDYKTDNHVMTMNLTDDFLYSEGRAVLECLVYNFCNDEVEALALTINGEPLNMFESMNFTNLTKDIGCNLVFEAEDLFNSDDLTMIYHYEDYLLPVTYYYDCSETDFDKIAYLVCKAMLVDEYASTIDFTGLISYETTTDTISFTINYDTPLSTAVINTLKDSVSVNYDFKEVLLNGVNI